jgi:ring-1,2-phenylacetyl-CoA epoxidase subunit PaaD
VSVVELGIVREVEVAGEQVTVTITPTYSGCPAMREIEADIVSALREHGIAAAKIRTVYTPAWTTEWISKEAKAKLEAYGIAPPGVVESSELVAIARRRHSVPCPYCKASATERKSEFGSTACKAIWFCRSCAQPFEEFKPL